MSQSSLLLKQQLRGRNTIAEDVDLTRNPVDGFSAGLRDDSNIYEWEVMIIGPEGTP
ncbi:Ubiquitin-conjugating enzyme 13 [Globomyces sp. JEL0801]|nr:Ubiquitin-conjugating enzyme 13 [Globomyces sp. JEL0801]